MKAIRIAIVTISDGVVSGDRIDTSGQVIAEWAARNGYETVAQSVIGDESVAIAATLARLADANEADVILTTGGTGLTERDVTPEATQSVLQRLAPGIAEAVRSGGAAKTPYAWLSRAAAGTRGKSLIINLPGSESGVRDGLAVLDGLLAHAVQLIRGIDTGKH